LAVRPDSIIAVHPVLSSLNVADSIRFFSKLGFEPIFRNDPDAPRYAAVQRGWVELHLQWADPNQWERGVDRPAYRFLVSDVDALFAEVLAAGAVRSGDGPWARPGDTPWGTREFHLRDPAGNVLQFYQGV
jgi:catechol 2,3-dioxygenase-like lactoylglutathione lyase family enzyme